MVTVQYRDPNGNIVTSDLNNAPPQVQTLYNQNYLQPQAQLQQTQAGAAVTSAEIPGAQARSQTATIQAQQAGALQNLGKDLGNKMTLGSALKKYTALGLSADDVFRNYLSQNTWGPNNTPAMPIETPEQLQGMGVSKAALGDINTPGSFMNKYNIKNAITSLRGLQDTFNKTSGLASIPLLGELFQKAYKAQALGVADHLSSLIPGASQGQGSNEGFLSKLPDPSNPADVAQADDIFNKLEEPLLQSNGYTAKSLGLPDKSQTQTSTQAPINNGKDLLTNLLTNAGKDFTGMIQGEAQREKTFGPGYGGAVMSSILGIPGLVKQYADIVENPGQQLTQHPVNTTLAVLGPLLGLKEAGAPESIAGETGADEVIAASGNSAASSLPKTPNPLMAKLFPNTSRDTGFALKDNAIKAIDLGYKSGTGGVSGDSVINYINDQLPTLKRAFPNIDPTEIDQWAKNIETQYKGKIISGTDAQKIYDTTPSDKTATGLQKERLSDHQNGILRDALSNSIEESAPGAGWKEGVMAQAKAFQAEKAAPAKIIKNLPQNLVKAGLNAASFGVLRDILGF